MANNWWDKFLDLFTEEVMEEEVFRQNRDLELEHKEEREDYRGGHHGYGRIEEVHRLVQPRMLSHYSQRNDVRIPVIDDRRGEIPRKPRRSHTRSTESANRRFPENKERKRNRVSVGKSSEELGKSQASEKSVQQRRRHSEKTTESRPEREKFTGVDFRASDVPSPVYGFRKRPDLGSQRDRRTEVDVTEPSSPFNESIVSPQEAEKSTERAESREKYTSPMEELYFYGYPEDKAEQVSEEPISFVSQEEPPVKESSDLDHPDSVLHGEEESAGKLDEENSSMDKGSIQEQKNDTYPSTPTEDPSSERVPYNVMMLKADKSEEDALPSSKSTYPSPPPKAEGEGMVAQKGDYHFPAFDLLNKAQTQFDGDEEWTREQCERLSETLQHFNVEAKLVGVTRGPAVTRFEVQPAPGVKVSKIKKLNDDLKLNLAAKDIRIEAPIPGKNSVGIEIPNRTSQPVYLREMIESQAFQSSESPLTAALGLDISGTPIVTDLGKMPHGLIGGATGSGKSVCINSLLVSLLYKVSPEELKLILVDPKVVELAPFRDIPHLAAPVINDPKEAALALKWAVEEMEQRYKQFAEAGARDIARYNQKVQDKMPYIVIVIDELADLMMVAPQDVEESICRIAQKARACGIHLILATQRPSVDVITGLIKANIPTRLAFSVSSQADSRTILDMGGAEKLLGHGDMLFVENGAPQSIRVQGNFVSDDEIDRITAFIKQQGKPDYLFEKEQLQQVSGETEPGDELFEEACFFVFEQGSASASALQRKFRIGYNRASRLIDTMESHGMISGAMGSKPRDLLISEDEFLEMYVK